MTQLNLTGWRPGLNKVQLTRTLQAELGLSLADAKRATDRVVDGEVVSLSLPDHRAAERLADLLVPLGTTVTIQGQPAVPKAAG